MSERELCDLLIRRGAAAGLPVDEVVEQLADVKFPAFIDMAAYRATLVEAAEGLLRSEYESKLAALRQKVYAEDAPPVNGVVEAPAPESADVAGHVLQTAPPETHADPVDEDDMDVFAAAQPPAEPAAASDETAIWVTDEGEPVRRQYPKS